MMATPTPSPPKKIVQGKIFPQKSQFDNPNDPTSVTTPPHMFQPVIETYVA